MKTLIRASTAIFAFALSTSATSAERNVDTAIKFLKDACVTSGSSLEIKATGSGMFQVKRLLGSGVAGMVTLSKKELQGFADGASALNAQQATDMRACMRPHIDRILAAILNDK